MSTYEQVTCLRTTLWSFAIWSSCPRSTRSLTTWVVWPPVIHKASVRASFYTVLVTAVNRVHNRASRWFVCLRRSMAWWYKADDTHAHTLDCHNDGGYLQRITNKEWALDGQIVAHKLIHYIRGSQSYLDYDLSKWSSLTQDPLLGNKTVSNLKIRYRNGWVGRVSTDTVNQKISFRPTNWSQSIVWQTLSVGT